MTNPNHPAPGDQIKVDPIRDLKDLRAIKALLRARPRDYCLFVLGINTALRASDLVRLTVGQVRHLKAGEHLEIRERKTGKTRAITLNRAVTCAIADLLATRPQAADHEALLSGQRGPLTVPSVHRLVKGWCRALRLPGNYGSHTLRKTFGYHQRVTFGRDLATLVEVFNHATQRQTLAYLGIQADEIRDVYLNEL